MTPSGESATARRLYVADLALLATHQVDAAFWHEWDVFGVPGGLPFFLAFNLVAVGLLATGLVRVASRDRSAPAWARFCAGVGFVTVGLHAVFLVLDRTAFWTPPSLAILVAILVTSVGLTRVASAAGDA